MICRACRKAGDFNKDKNYTQAYQYHLICHYPESCTCQHIVGEGMIQGAEAKES